MKKIEKIKIETRDTEVTLVEPSNESSIKKYYKELPEQYKGLDFQQLPEQYQHSKLASYCEFMKEVIPNNIHLINKANTLIACALATINFSSYHFELEFHPTQFNTIKHLVKIDISFKFNYLEEPSETNIEIHESDMPELVANEKTSDIWQNKNGILDLANNVFETFFQLDEQSKLVITTCLLLQIQNAIDINSQDSVFECNGFSDNSLDQNSTLAQTMACTKMVFKLYIDSPQYKMSKNKLH